MGLDHPCRIAYNYRNGPDGPERRQNMKYDKVRALLSTTKGKAIAIAAAAGIALGGTAVGVTIHNNGAEQARLEEQAQAEALQDEMDADSAKEVDSLIDAIGEVTLDSENAITKAEDGYNKLNDNAKGFVLKYDTLKDARSTYDTLVAARDNADTTSGAEVAENADTVTDESPLETPKVEDTAKKQAEKTTTASKKKDTSTKKPSASTSTASTGASATTNTQTTPTVTTADASSAPAATTPTPDAPAVTPTTPAATPSTDTTSSQPGTPADTAGTDLSQYDYGMSNATVTDNGDGTVTSTGNFANGGPAVITVTTDTNTGETDRSVTMNGVTFYNQ